MKDEEKNKKITDCSSGIYLNLIPPEKKTEIETNWRFRKIIKTDIALAVAALIFIGMLLFFWRILSWEFSAQVEFNRQIENAEKFEQIKKYDEQFTTANEKIKQVSAINESQMYWSGVFLKLSHSIVEGVRINSLVTDNYKIKINGESDTRESLLAFKASLEKEDCFENIDLPLSSLVLKSNVQFQMSFDIRPDCLKNNVK